MSTTRTKSTRVKGPTIEQIRAELARWRTRHLARAARDAFSSLFENRGLGEVTVRGVTKTRGTVLTVRSAAFDDVPHGARQDFAWTVLTRALAPSDIGQIADLMVLDSRGGEAPPPKPPKRRKR